MGGSQRVKWSLQTCIRDWGNMYSRVIELSILFSASRAYNHTHTGLLMALNYSLKGRTGTYSGYSHAGYGTGWHSNKLHQLQLALNITDNDASIRVSINLMVYLSTRSVNDKLIRHFLNDAWSQVNMNEDTSTHLKHSVSTIRTTLVIRFLYKKTSSSLDET